MANQFLQYPYQISKAVNGGYICVDPKDANNFYAFSTQADLTYWLGLNEQAPAPVDQSSDGTHTV
jgi:hypothetical protein